MTRRLPCLALIVLVLASPGLARADAPASSSASSDAGRHRIPPHLKIDRPPSATSVGNGSWWVGLVVMAVALAGLGAASLAARHWMPNLADGGGAVRVVGRTSLSPKHSIHLLKTGDRILIIGTGPQGAPSLLGELDDPDEIARLSARASATALPSVGRLLGSLTKTPGATS